MGTGRSARGGLANVLAVLAAIVLLGAATTAFASRAFFDSGNFADRAASALDDEAVRAELGTRITDDLLLNAEPDLVAVRPVVESGISGLLGQSVFQDVFRTAVADVHSTFLEGNEDSATFTLADIGAVLRGALQALAPEVAEKIKGKADIQVTEVEPPEALTEVVQTGESIAGLSWVLLGLGLAVAGVALWIASDRRRTALVFGVAAAITGVLAVVGLDLARGLVLSGVSESVERDAARGIWDAFLADLRFGFFAFAACGAVVAAAASSLVRPVDVGAPLERAWTLITTVPATTRMRTLRGMLLLAAGILVVLRRDTVLDLALLLAGIYIAYAGVSELMRLTLSETSADEQTALARRGSRTLVVTGIAAAAIFVIGGTFVATGGTEEARGSLDTVGCNGSLELCDRPLDTVAFAATHNAMSAVTNKNWLFGQQDAGFPEQLDEGVRALLIDAHHGRPTESGTVATDLSSIDTERETYEAELGEEALDAALRLRDRVIDSPASGPRGVYLCHRFCELGSIPIEEGFRNVRDFLAANSNEVLIIVIEDYVPPSEIEKAAIESGLIDYIYEGPVVPAPTLQEVIDSGGRAVMMAERDAGAGTIPWYHEVYGELVQETPYSFKNPAALIGRQQLDASCKPNRGPDDAPFFLLNHWVDTSPAPRPSNATEVNAEEALLRRIHRCERDRGLEANLIAVDFYREGDIFDVVKALNEERGDAEEPE